MMQTNPAPSPELAARVAVEVMGYVHIPRFASHEHRQATVVYVNPNIKELWRGVPYPSGKPNDIGYYHSFYNWRPDLHIAQAWEVVEKLIEIGWTDMSLCYCDEEQFGEGEEPFTGWLMSLGNNAWVKFPEKAPHPQCLGIRSIRGTTAPLAICLAALKAVDE